MSIKKNSLSNFILAFLCSGRNTATFHRLMNSDELCEVESKSVRVSLFRLERNKYVQKTMSGWQITPKGERLIRSLYLNSPFNKKAVKNTVVAFDIHEYDRKIRSWIRGQLKVYGYEMLQQSLWYGPGPLPKDFINRLEELGVRKDVRIFTVNK